MQRRLTALLGNSQRLDGGAMFGNAPKAVWSRWIPADEHNRIPLACRAMLIEECTESGEVQRRILCDAGIGTFFAPELRERYGVVEADHRLLSALQTLDLRPEDIDIVVLSHLHFDHVGGLLGPWQADEPLRLLFAHARFVVSAGAWARALKPHPRDRASFIEGLPALLEASAGLEIVAHAPGQRWVRSETLGAAYRLYLSEGHTPGQLLIEVPSAEGPVVFGGDLIPGLPWLHLPITMGYDRSPELLIDEKRALLEELLPLQGRIFFTHDPQIALARPARNERGRFGPAQQWAQPSQLKL